ncbi:hypothetical protein KCP69_13880 [Salmonella enterica subsp. enterica]|nr:hypothetical protein KCP69_13880 [Salmonella enterica subsp. enterica]
MGSNWCGDGCTSYTPAQTGRIDITLIYSGAHKADLTPAKLPEKRLCRPPAANGRGQKDVAKKWRYTGVVCRCGNGDGGGGV